ncbi:MAG TPA: DUF2914 domain-containing protein [Vicinamibacterales bacterium]|nr:DUF2914 domain-containing protein [Vicinamibacterales bacterium]
MSETDKSSAAHRPWKELAFFAAGFIVDAFLVRRIDETRTLIQQGLYLAVDGVLLARIIAWRQHGPQPGRWRERLPRAADWLLHFTLGTLLNAYALFYVKSASGIATVVFFLIIASLLLINELPAMRRLGPVVLYGLYSFCLTSYFAYLYPVLIGRIRWWMFVLAVATAAVPLSIVALAHHRWTRDRTQVVRHALAPSFGVQALLLALYGLRLIPPVPLSLMEIGIYHAVERTDDGAYRVTYRSPPWYRFWQHDDRQFLAAHGDRVYCFFRVFAPNGFRDEVRVDWFFDEPSHGWTNAGGVPIAVTGGRDDGFAGYAYKQNWRTGEWRVVVSSIDRREIGRRSFSVRDDRAPADQRPMTDSVR